VRRAENELEKLSDKTQKGERKINKHKRERER